MEITPSNTGHQMYFKIGEPMFQMLVSGKEVIIPQPDGPTLHFFLEDMGYDRMLCHIFNAQRDFENRDGT